MIITHCSYCDYTPCRCTPEAIERRSMRWMSYEEAMAHKKLMNQKEQELLRSWGLGWIAEFCSKPFKEE